MGNGQEHREGPALWLPKAHIPQTMPLIFQPVPTSKPSRSPAAETQLNRDLQYEHTQTMHQPRQESSLTSSTTLGISGGPTSSETIITSLNSTTSGTSSTLTTCPSTTMCTSASASASSSASHQASTPIAVVAGALSGGIVLLAIVLSILLAKKRQKMEREEQLKAMHSRFGNDELGHGFGHEGSMRHGTNGNDMRHTNERVYDRGHGDPRRQHHHFSRKGSRKGSRESSRSKRRVDGECLIT